MTLLPLSTPTWGRHLDERLKAVHAAPVKIVPRVERTTNRFLTKKFWAPGPCVSSCHQAELFGRIVRVHL